MDERRFVEDVLRDAAERVIRLYRRRTELSISTKRGATDLVTQGDLETQRFVQQTLAEHFPDDRLVAEEDGLDTPPDDPDQRCWVLDPIDGTHNFAIGLMPSFGVSLALVEHGQPQVAGIALPMLDQILLAERGAGAFRGDQQLAVSDVTDFDRAKVEVDFSRLAVRAELVQQALPILQQAGQVRSHGSAVVGLSAIATADCDGYFHAGLNPWDFAAAMLLITEAGGQFTRLDGHPVHIFDGKRGIAAGNPAIHRQILQLIG